MFPSFWKLQAGGWACFYVFVLVSSLPFLKQPGVFRDDNLFIAWLFLASCWLRFGCRSLWRRSLPWLALEVRAIGLSLLAGAVTASGLAQSVEWIARTGWSWASWLVDFVQCSVVLFLWCSLYFSIQQWRQSTEEKERLLRAESEAREARLNALRYQLNPHFLFNSLNAVSTLILEGNSAAATRMLAQIAELLRTTLGNHEAREITLSQEVAFTGRYLEIERTRLGERLRVDFMIAPETLDALVPNMLLQPLVENAVRHGIAPLIEGGTIVVRSHRLDDGLKIVVRNSGPRSAGGGAAGVGLSNTAERLRTLYGAGHRFELAWPEEGGCQVRVEIPFRKREPEAPPCAR